MNRTISRLLKLSLWIFPWTIFPCLSSHASSYRSSASADIGVVATVVEPLGIISKPPIAGQSGFLLSEENISYSRNLFVREPVAGSSLIIVSSKEGEVLGMSIATQSSNKSQKITPLYSRFSQDFWRHVSQTSEVKVTLIFTEN